MSDYAVEQQEGFSEIVAINDDEAEDQHYQE